MKKFLALMLVLGMASMANAALTIMASPDGQPGTFVEVISSEILLAPTETIWLAVEETEALPGGYAAWLGIPEDQMAKGEWTGNNALFSPPAQGDATWYTYAGGTPYYGFSYWTLTNTIAGVDLNTPGIAGAVEFHCLDLGPVDITYGYDGPLTPGHQILTIHQIPEPMTMALLGLGGLGLIRRRR